MITEHEEFKNAKNSIVFVKKQIIKAGKDIELEITNIYDNDMGIKTTKPLNNYNRESTNDNQNIEIYETQKLQFNRTTNDSETNVKKPLRSILKKSKYLPKTQSPQEVNSLNTVRLDATGSLIQAGGKNHKITFRDNIHDVTLVENWKEYNMENYESEKCNCRTCNIF